MKKILLLSMPFGALERQALGISMFKSKLCSEGFQCDISYLTFTFASLIGVDNYCWVTNELPHTAFAGDYVFSHSLYNTINDPVPGYIQTILRDTWHLDERSLRRVIRIREMTHHFLDYCMDTISWNEYSLVGFTSTFEQNIASLALARRIKTKLPDMLIVFGGANWEGEMGLELHGCFPFVDYAFTGEADESFPAFVRLLRDGNLSENSIKKIPGLIYRKDGRSHITAPPMPVSDLDSLPVPDYSDYFSGFDRLLSGSMVVPALLFESARGCWWGEKHHCRFCGLNGNMLSFRAKSASRVLSEVEYLSETWKTDTLQAVDNVVSMSYFNDLFPELSRKSNTLKFFYEIRSTLTREQVKMLSMAGIKNVQPGIESLSDNILHLMRKGTTTMQNIQILKWCKEFGIRPSWNLIYGFPGESDKDYQEIFELLPKIRFLDAPAACGPVRLDRFSPYFNDQSSSGLINVRPVAPYRFLYPFGEKSISRIACYFDYDYSPGTKVSALGRKLQQVTEEWKKSPEWGEIQCMDTPGHDLVIVDTRSDAKSKTATLKGIDRAVYLLCDKLQTPDSIMNYLREKFPGLDINRDQIIAFLNALVSCGYQITDGKSYLSLALHA